MTYSDVTLSPDDIDWDRPQDPVKVAVFDENAFWEILTTHGAERTVELFHAFHRDVANQLIRTATKSPDVSSWAARAIGLCGAAKWRRNMARRIYRLEHGVTAELEYRHQLATKYPRAEWGAAL